MAQPEPEIPRRNRLVYASGSLGGNAMTRARDLWLIFFFAPPAGEDMPTLVPRLLLAALLALARVIEAFYDPLIGHWSDRTRSRWGRRIPFVIAATPFYALFFVLLWTPPDDQESLRNALYFFFMLEVFSLFAVLSGGPFEALLPEIAPRAKERVSIVTWQVFFGALGAVVGLVISGFIIDAFGFPAMAAAIAVIALISRYLALAGAWRHVKREVEPVRINIVEAFRITFRNDQFLYFLPTFVLFNMAITMMTAALPFFSEAVILGGREEITVRFFGFARDLEKGALTGLFTAVAILVVILFLPFMYRLAGRRGKAWLYSAALLIAGLYLPFLFFMGFIPGIPKVAQTLALVAFLGIPMAAAFIFPNAIIADIVDYDALKTGMRREAMYYGAQNTIEKWALALYAPILAGVLLLGETADDPLGIRLLGPVAGLAALVGFLTFRGYRLPDTVTAETVAIKGMGPKPRPGPLS